MNKVDSKILKEKLGVVQWQDIEEQFIGSDILIGNGLSIKISNKLRYDSLYETFKSSLSDDQVKIFNNFETSDFEQIQQKINDAIFVNDIFKINNDKLQESIDVLKSGLIRAINENHPRNTDIDSSMIEKISIALDPFEDIYTTNYDVFLYKIIMNNRDRVKLNKKIKPYQDYFWNKIESDNYLKFMDSQANKQYKHVYYLHGSLFIFKYPDGNFKIKKNDDDKELLEIIGSNIQKNEFPLFVTEGYYKQKEQVINSNGYLSFCRTKFKNAGEIVNGKKRKLVIYGLSLSNQDKHLINDLNYHGRTLAISIHCKGKTLEEIRNIKNIVVSKFNRLRDEEIIFFDSCSLF